MYILLYQCHLRHKKINYENRTHRDLGKRSGDYESFL
jgi:hypothetical protein